MKVFYWTASHADNAKQLYQVNTETHTVLSSSGYNVDLIESMLEDGYIEISPDTAYKLGLPS